MSRALAFIGIAAAGGCGDPHVRSGYESPIGANGLLRRAGHSGVDFKGNDGDPVLAVGFGRVESVTTNDVAGTCVLLAHECRRCGFERYFTSYCHLQKASVRAGQLVPRGAQIGELGHSGRGALGVSHVHLSMCAYPCASGTEDGELRGMIDPERFDVGCFVPEKTYAVIDRPVLTHPIACAGR